MASATDELNRLESELSKLQAKKEEALSSLGQALDLAAVEQGGNGELDRFLTELAEIRGDCQRVQDGRRQIDNLHQECKDLDAELPEKRERLGALRTKIEGSYLTIGEAAAALYSQLTPQEKTAFEEYYQPLVKFTEAQQAKEEEEKKKGFFKKLVNQRNLAAEEEERVQALSEVGKRVFVAPDFLATASRDATFRAAVSVPEQLLIEMEPLEVEIPQLEQRLSEVRESMQSARAQAAELGGQDRRMALWLDIGRLVFQQDLSEKFPDVKLAPLDARVRDLHERIKRLEHRRTEVQALLKLEELQGKRADVDQEREQCRKQIQVLQGKIAELGQEEARLQMSARQVIERHGEGPLLACFATFNDGTPPLADAVRPVQATPRPGSGRVPPPTPAPSGPPTLRGARPATGREKPPSGRMPPPLPPGAAVTPPLPARRTPALAGNPPAGQARPQPRDGIARAPVAPPTPPPGAAVPPPPPAPQPAAPAAGRPQTMASGPAPARAPGPHGPPVLAGPRTTTRRRADELAPSRAMTGRSVTQRQAAVSGPSQDVRPAVFLDRDGTIIEDVHFLRRTEDVHFLPGVIEALQLLLQHQYRLVVVSNQSGIARGYFSPQDVEGIHRFMARSLAQQGVRIAGWYFCPHHPEGVISQFKTACNCRKPAPRLLTHAAGVHSLDLSQSWMVGDKWSDVQAGIAAGARGVLVRTGKGRDEEKRSAGPATFICDNLPAAVQAILSSEPIARQ